MWLKLGPELRNCAAIKRCENCIEARDHNRALRALIALDILIASVNEATWADSVELSRQMGYQAKSCKIVWDILVDEGVLRQLRNGRYSAIEWLRDKKFTGDQRPQQPAAPQKQQAKSVTSFF